MASDTYVLRKHGSFGNEYALECTVPQLRNIRWDAQLSSLKAIRIPNDEPDLRPSVNVRPTEISTRTLRRLFPVIKTNPRNIEDYKLLFAWEYGESTIFIKGAIQHRITGDIALLSSTNLEPSEKHFPAVENGWFTYGSEQIAPICYWNSFKVL